MKKLDNEILDISLTHFDGEGGGTAGGAPAAGDSGNGDGGSANPPDGGSGEPNRTPEQDAENRRAEYAKFKEANKDLFGEDVKKHVEDRLKKFKPMEQQLSVLSSDVSELLELTGAKDLAEAKELLKKQHEKQIENEAYEKGIDLIEYRKQKDTEREAAAYRAIQQREAFAQKMLTTWQGQAVELVKTYKDFNLQTASSNPAVLEMLKSGHSLKSAYETVNAAAILGAVPEYEGFDFANWQPDSAFIALLENGFEIRNAFEATNIEWTKQAAAKQAEKRTVDTIKGGGRVKELGGQQPKGGQVTKTLMQYTPAEQKKIMDDILAGRAKPSDYGM